MANFAVLWTYTDDKSKIGAAKQAHVDYLKDLVARGTVTVAGGWPDGSGGLVVFDVANHDELQPLLDKDPFTTEGVIVDTTIKEWSIALGSVGAAS
ncbi:YciI family protein [Antrihabitans stalactiti]|nr:YciI family protein [Antrihabitans stalactiti]